MRWSRFRPTANGDPVLAACGEALADAQRSALDRLSVDDRRLRRLLAAAGSTRTRRRSRTRRAAASGSRPNSAWQDFGARQASPVAILRLAGIYGPGQNALVQIARGKARRIVKPGQVFNRIHVGDIAQSDRRRIHAKRASGIFNVADDEPSPPGDPIVFAAQLLGREPPPEIPFAEAAPTMSPMALSFWQDCRRVRNDKLKRELGVNCSTIRPTARDRHCRVR